MRVSACLAVVLTIGGAARALAQSGANVTIQLPNVSTFGVNTTVLVPDSGPSPLALERQASYNRAMYGPRPRQGTIGLNNTVSGASITAQIHDQWADDAAVLRDARARRANWVRGSTPSIVHGTQSPSRPALQSVAQIERHRAEQQSATRDESLQLVEQARRAHLAGKSGVAAIYYQMGARRAGGELKRAIESEAARLKRSVAAQAAKPIVGNP
jgi:hypothetical protein